MLFCSQVHPNFLSPSPFSCRTQIHARQNTKYQRPNTKHRIEQHKHPIMLQDLLMTVNCKYKMQNTRFKIEADVLQELMMFKTQGSKHYSNSSPITFIFLQIYHFTKYIHDYSLSFSPIFFMIQPI